MTNLITDIVFLILGLACLFTAIFTSAGLSVIVISSLIVLVGCIGIVLDVTKNKKHEGKE